LPPGESDAADFAALIGDVAPLPPHDRAEIARPRPSPIPAQRLRDDAAALRESLSDHIPHELALETGEALRFLRSGLPAETVRKLRRGHWRIDGQLDLHGHSVDEARAALSVFLEECRRHAYRCVRIVHGKGLRSKNREPVLKAKVAGWLAQRDEVLAYCEARPADGGGGAVVVLLKSASRKS
jgi:DNA-nicking Smr family endonuclease